MNQESFLHRLFGKNTPAFSASTEIIAGITTFLTMAYIITVNANILSQAGMDRVALITATCVVAGLVTIATGIFTNTPIAMAPGMGMNAFFAYTLVLNQGIPWPVALGIVFMAGLVFFLLTLVGLRQKLVEAVPEGLLNAIAVGIGVFIAFMGLQGIGLVIDDPATLVKGGVINTTVLIGLAGLVVMIIMEILKIRGSLLVGIFFATVLSVIVGQTPLPKEVFSFQLSISPIFLKLDILGALKLSLMAPIFAMMFMDMFDSIGSLLGLAREADMMDKDGKVPKLDSLLIIDSTNTMFSGICGVSPATTYIESASGIVAGGRTGLTSIVTGGLFLLSMLFIPVLAIVPVNATAPALIMVGFFMMKNILNIDFKDLGIGFPSFLIIILIALSYSISTGLAFGFLSFTLIKLVRGKWGEIRPTLWVITILSLIFLIV